MAFSSRSYPLAVVCTLSFCLLLQSFGISYAAECTQSLFYERCTKKTDCIGHLDNFTNTICIGRDQNDNLQECPHRNVSVCVCSPLTDRYCRSNDDCPDEMYCGISPRTFNTLCVGCQVLSDPEVDFKPVKYDKNRCGKKHPPCGRALDLCSTTMPCLDNYNCAHTQNGKSYFLCGQEQSPCQCFPQIRGSDAPVTLQECESDENCTDDREACVWDVSKNRNYCASCDSVNVMPSLVLNDTRKCDQLKVKRRSPRAYVNSPNGLTYDYCYSDKQCIGDRICLQYVKPDNFLKFKPCVPSYDNFCFCRPASNQLVSCKNCSDCDRGESCSSVPMANINKKCVSNSFLDARSAREYKLIGGNKEPCSEGSGSGLTWDTCNYDWDCKTPRRCTSVEDSFGGCAGRGACTCRNLINPACENNAQCKHGEICVKYKGGISSPFCVSPKALINYSYLSLVSSHDEFGKYVQRVTAAFGFTEDPCMSDDDCIAPRSCKHMEGNSSCTGDRIGCTCEQKSDTTKPCESTLKDCPIGEVCAVYKGVVINKPKCISEMEFDADVLPMRRILGGRHSEKYVPPSDPTPESTIEPDPEDQEDTAKCIDTKLLANIHETDLVFNKARRGAVLCDENDSCATPGHMVTYKGKAMTMRTYCSKFCGSCEKRTRWVNSPRFKNN